ncbi:MAG: tRNA lysidine(34) synthetase TilS [Roseiflexaceae bacterium]
MSAYRIITQLTSQLAVRPTGPLIVAVSGGPDSLALLYALCESGIAADLHVYHLDHGLRGEQSAADADWVRQCATALGLPHRIEKADIACEAPHHHNLNEAARIVRYRRLAQYANDIDAAAVLVAHTRDDQAETVMMRLLRGSGPTGLAAMRTSLTWEQWAHPDIHGRALLIRPLLNCDRSDVIDYCATRDLTPRHDPSNDKHTNQRVRMRHQVLPALRHEQPQLNTILGRTARLCGDDADYIALQIIQMWPTFAQHNASSVTFARTVFNQLHIALQRAAIRHAIHHLHGSLRSWNLEHVEYIRNAIHHPPSQKQQLPLHTILIVSDDTALLSIPTPLLSAPHIDAPQSIIIPSQIDCGDDWWLHASIEPAQTNRNRWHAFLPTHHKYIARTRHPGEMMSIGHGRHRRLQDIMVDARIPALQRNNWPIITTQQHIVWVPGVRIDPAFVAQPDDIAIHLSLIRSADNDNFGYD